jgi:hypothetical protein
VTREPKIGDLVYCKCVGSSAGWRLHQTAVIVGYKINMKAPYEGRMFYDLYFSSGRGHVMCVPISDFEKGDVVRLDDSSF